jgi:hypothetical protein
MRSRGKTGPKPRFPLGLRICTDCGSTKPVAEFVPIRKTKTGFYGPCRPCRTRRGWSRGIPAVIQGVSGGEVSNRRQSCREEKSSHYWRGGGRHSKREAYTNITDPHGLQTYQGDIGVCADKGVQVELVRETSCLPRKTSQRAISLQPRDPRC